MAKKSVTVTMHIEGLRESLRAFNELPKDASAELRDESLKLATTLAARVQADGISDAAPQSHLVATTVKPVRDRTPAIQAGGTKRLGRNKAPAYKLLFGSIFGSNYYKQFRRQHQGRDAYWFFNVVETGSTDITTAWQNVADSIVRKFSEGG